MTVVHYCSSFFNLKNTIMKNLKILTLALFAIAIMMSSCSKEETITPTIKDQISTDVVQKIKSLDMNTDGIKIEDVQLPDGTTEKSYILEGDIAVPISQLESMLSDERIEGAHGEQYRTCNLVCGTRTIKVLGYTGGSFALTTKMKVGLSWAIANYNALPLRLSFSLSYGTNTWGKDIVVYKVAGSAGGSAGFPSGCNPYKWVRINAGTNSYSYNVNEHVIGHEIGHCLGLRHTDWFNRASCGGTTGEGSAGVCAIHIPGTPTGIDWNSLMLACFSTGTNGEFSYYDKVALNYMY